MKQLVYIATCAIALCITACDTGNAQGDNNQCDSDTVAVVTIDSTQLQEVTGVVIDGARRSIELQVDDDTISYELDGDFDATWQIGDTLTLRYYMTRNSGDSVVEVIDHQM